MTLSLLELTNRSKLAIQMQIIESYAETGPP